MSKAAADFNYKVALASGLKSLQAGRLRQAEEQFRYLTKHFPTADGGYRGLAKVLIEQEDRAAALRVLLDGGAALAKGDERAGAIALYREAVSLDPRDLAAHRRLAAALTLAGDGDEAAREYTRFIDAAVAAGDTQRAELERAYASGQSGMTIDAPAAPAPATETETEVTADERAALMRSAFGETAAPEPAAIDAALPAQSWESAVPAASEPVAAQPANAWQPEPAAWEQPAPSAPLPPADLPADADSSVVEATAASYLAQGDPRGGSAALEAARRYIADGRMDAASDLLLQLIAAGIADHEAQRLLVEVTKNIGRRDVARAKVDLLVQALRLDGRNDLAAEVEQLAQAF